MKTKLILAFLPIVAVMISCGESREKVPAGAIVMTVTENGFEPAKLTVNRNQPVQLIVTRKTDRTCATEIVIDEFGVNEELPLGRPVTVAFTPTEAGEIKFGCGMDKMIGGTLVVR